MTAPLGATVRLFYDSPARVAPGDCLVTPTGRTYLIMSVRVQVRGKHAGRRQHLACLVQSAPPVDARLHVIRWYKRQRAQRRAC